jgi:hypothetical protein
VPSGEFVVRKEQITAGVATYHDRLVGYLVTSYALSVSNDETFGQWVNSPEQADD